MTSKVFILAGMIAFVGLLPLRVPKQEVQGSKSKVQGLDFAASNESKTKTWKTLDELSVEEKAMLDLRVDTPRDPQIPYLPAEKFPFAAPYTAEEMGLRCPEDFGMVSFDDYPWLAIFHPKLTTVELPKYQLGSEAVELLLDRIAGNDGPGVVKKLMPELRVRESCGFKQVKPVVAAAE